MTEDWVEDDPAESHGRLSKDYTELAHYRVMRTCGLLAICGSIGLGVIETIEHSLPLWLDHSPPLWLHPLGFFLHHLAAIVAAVGVVGLIFEWTERKRLVEEMVAQMRQLFQADPTFAKHLRKETSQKLVENTLSAHLGSKLGPAIYEGLVSKYLTQETVHREDVRYEVSLAELEQAITVAGESGSVTFTPDKYFSLTSAYEFKRQIKAGHRLIAFTLAEDESYTELYNLFQHPECLAREVIQLEQADKQELVNCLGSIKGAYSQERIENFLWVSVTLNGRKIPTVLKIHTAKHLSFSWELGDIPKEITDAGSVDYEICIKTLIAKSFHRFPVLLAEPALNPRIVFNYPKDILRVITVPFINGNAPFDPTNVTEIPMMGRITVNIANPKSKDAWAFPNSGALFIWKEVPHEATRPVSGKLPKGHGGVN
ncbi:MAG TPA: hypothetical protein VJ723_12025 [Candidatus Angelobacter sp.]|nr:hypothetical protein [Candidatus Angelobacter sp.]